MTISTDLTILQGKTFNRVLRLSALPYVYKAITGITQAAPAVITATGHGLLNGQKAAVVSVHGMTQINSPNTPPRYSDFHKITYVDPNTISLNDTNSTDFDAYISGGYLQYLTPTDLAGATARMSIKDVIGGTELLRLDTTNSRIVIDNAAKTITLTIDAVTTAGITWNTGVYDLELVVGSIVTLLLSGAISVIPEVTTT
jgi:hypothetical protein